MSRRWSGTITYSNQPNPQTKALFGRDQELSLLTEAIESSISENLTVTFISGESGVGKSALAETALGQLKYPAQTSRIRDYSTPPYAPIATLLREFLKEHGLGNFDIGPLSQYLPLILPELGDAPSGSDRQTIFEAITAAVARFATDKPAVILFDDLQWSDNATLEILPYMVEKLTDAKLAIVATYRSDEIDRGHALRRTRNELRRLKRLQEIKLDGLKTEAIEELAGTIIGSRLNPDLSSKLGTLTQGIPLYIEELTRSLHEGGALVSGGNGLELRPGTEVPLPESIRDAILLRMDTLSQEAREKLDIAAIAGMQMPIEMMAALATNEAGIDELLERGILIGESAGQAAFKHGLIREAVKSELNWSRRRELHRKIGNYLDERGAPPEILAEHLLAAREDERARVALLKSAERSCELYAYRDAAKAGQKALDLWPQDFAEAERIATVERLAHCAQVSGMLSDAVKAWREVADSSEVQTDPKRLANAYRSLAIIYALQHAWQQSIEARKAAAKHLLAAGSESEAAAELLAAASRLTGTVQLSSALETALTAQEFAVKSGDAQLESRALALEGEIRAMQGDPEKGRECAQNGLSIALRGNHVKAAGEIYRRLAAVLAYSSDYGAAREAYSTAVEFCRSRGEETSANVCMGCMSFILFQTGDWKRAVETAKEILNENTPIASRATAEGVMGIVALYRGEIRQARKLLEHVLAVSKQHRLTIMELLTFGGLAGVAEAESRMDEARLHYQAMTDLWLQARELHDVIPSFCSAATFFAASGDEKGLAVCAEALGEIAAATTSPEGLAGLAFALGETAALQKDPGNALTHFLQAIEHVDKLDLPLSRATVRVRAGTAALAANQRDVAIKLLREAYTLSRKIGARPLGDTAGNQLAQLGVTVEESRGSESGERSGRGGLTKRQLEIARLLGDGLTNREIAEKLFLSRRTVDMHVGNILNRLDARSRSEAVKKVSKLGLIDSDTESCN